MEMYIDYLCDLAAYIKKNAQIANTHIFKSEGVGLGCLLTLDNIATETPPRVGRELSVTVKIYAPINNWKQLLQAMGRIEGAFTDCTSKNNELKIKYHLTLGAWSRTEDESNIIFVNSLTINCVRLEN